MKIHAYFFSVILFTKKETDKQRSKQYLSPPVLGEAIPSIDNHIGNYIIFSGFQRRVAPQIGSFKLLEY